MLNRLLGETIHLECVCEPGLPPVLADANSIGQVIMNLAVNARDAMPEGGKLLISTRRVNHGAVLRAARCAGREFVQLTVADSGCGMDTQTLSHEPFSPPNRPARARAGPVHRVRHCKQHGGWMESAHPGWERGSCWPSPTNPRKRRGRSDLC
jgi:hypothetical protein